MPSFFKLVPIVVGGFFLFLQNGYGSEHDSLLVQDKDFSINGELTEVIIVDPKLLEIIDTTEATEQLKNMIKAIKLFQDPKTYEIQKKENRKK